MEWVPRFIYRQFGPDGITVESHNYIIQRGDLLKIDMGVSSSNYGTDIQRMAYVLRDDETEIPEGIQHAFNQALKAREVIRKTIKVGRTAGETLKAIGHALETAGFGYIPGDPTMDGGFSGLKRGEQIKHPEKTEVAIDCHCVGNTGNGDVAVGPSIANFRPDRAHLTIHPNNLFAFEFMAYTAVPEWGGRKVRIGYEDDAIVTVNGVEWLYPETDRIFVIH